MNKGLLVDIGGTNMRYAIASNDQEDISKINKTEFDTLDFETFLRKLVVDNEIDTLIISIAGPKINNSIRMTNRDYSINSDQLKKNLNLKECIILNDWEAIAHSYSHLFGIPITMFRFFTVYGPLGRPDMALFKFTESIINNDEI